MPRGATAQASFWALDRFVMEKVVANIAGEFEIRDGDVLASLELGADIEFVVMAHVVKRSFSEKGTGQAILQIVSATPSGGQEMLSRKATKAADAAKDVTPAEAPAKRGRPKKSDPAFDTCGIVHHGMVAPCMNPRGECEMEAADMARQAEVDGILTEAEQIASQAQQDAEVGE